MQKFGGGIGSKPKEESLRQAASIYLKVCSYVYAGGCVLAHICACTCLCVCMCVCVCVCIFVHDTLMFTFIFVCACVLYVYMCLF